MERQKKRDHEAILPDRHDVSKCSNIIWNFCSSTYYCRSIDRSTPHPATLFKAWICLEKSRSRVTIIYPSNKRRENYFRNLPRFRLSKSLPITFVFVVYFFLSKAMMMNSCSCGWSKLILMPLTTLFLGLACTSLEKSTNAQEVPTLNDIPQYEYIYVYECESEDGSIARAPLTDFSTTISAPGRGGRGGGGNGGIYNINFTIPLASIFNETISSSSSTTTATTEVNTNSTAKRVVKRYRQKICDRYDSYANGNVELKDALSGLQVRPIIQVGDGYFHIDKTTGGIKETNPGFIAHVLDEVASRGNFTWRQSFGITYGPTTSEYPNKTWTELGVWSIDMYDFSADWWLHSLERLRLGYTFPEGFVDGHYIMIQLKDDQGGGDGYENVSLFDKDHFLWSLTKPFTVGVWIMNLVTIFFTAMLYAFFESQHDTASSTTSSKTTTTTTNASEIGKSIYGSILIAFRHFAILKPRTLPGKIITISLSFWSLITIAIYTANLTSFFVLQNTPKIQIQTIQDVIDNGMSMCVYENGGIHEYVTRYYPKANLIPISTNKFGHIEALQHGHCSITLANMNEWEQVEISKEYIGQCQYEWLGRIFHFEQAGFAFQLDSGVYCTSFMKDVFHTHIKDMINDGTMARLKQQSFSLQQTVHCNERDISGGGGGGGGGSDEDDADDDATTSVSSSEDDSSERIGILSLKELSGPFLNHGIIMIVAIIVSSCYERRSRRPERRGTANASSPSAIESGVNHSTATILNETTGNTTCSGGHKKDALATIDEHGQQSGTLNEILPSKSSSSTSSLQVVSRHVRSQSQRQNVLGLNQNEFAKRMDKVLEREDETIELIMALLKKALEEADGDGSEKGAGGSEGDGGRRRQSGDNESAEKEERKPILRVALEYFKPN